MRPLSTIPRGRVRPPIQLSFGSLPCAERVQTGCRLRLARIAHTQDAAAKEMLQQDQSVGAHMAEPRLHAPAPGISALPLDREQLSELFRRDEPHAYHDAAKRTLLFLLPFESFGKLLLRDEPGLVHRKLT
jgi:hypothetical protein